MRLASLTQIAFGTHTIERFPDLASIEGTISIGGEGSDRITAIVDDVVAVLLQSVETVPEVVDLLRRQAVQNEEISQGLE